MFARWRGRRVVFQRREGGFKGGVNIANSRFWESQHEEDNGKRYGTIVETIFSILSKGRETETCAVISFNGILREGET